MKMIKNFDSKYDDYSFSPKIKHIFFALGLWIRKKRFWVVKLIYKNKSLNNYIKDERRIL